MELGGNHEMLGESKRPKKMNEGGGGGGGEEEGENE